MNLLISGVLSANGIAHPRWTVWAPLLALYGLVFAVGDLLLARAGAPLWVAIPFAVLVFIVVRRFSANSLWAALLAAVITMVAFVCAVNAAIFIDGQTNGASKMMRNILSGLAGGFVGSAVMALGMALLPAGPRDAVTWLRMLLTGTLAGTLLALDNALDLDMTSFLYPVWQAAVAVRLAMALRRRRLS